MREGGKWGQVPKLIKKTRQLEIESRLAIYSYRVSVLTCDYCDNYSANFYVG